ncbi:MAG: methyl-accepting chemotaxis protein [Candidatus Eremiobacteraeota bacterium]|nr:methyl-accepting chemotaxis protein [Candidatus Eremiobacteraeota bacterium]
MRNLSIKNKLLLSLVLNLAAFACIAGLQWQALKRVEIRWDFYRQQVVQRQVLLEDIRASLGYGGAIHLFKNYLLRGEPRDEREARQKLEDALQILESYKKLGGITPEELGALAVIADMVENHLDKLELVVRLRSAGTEVTTIDQQVRFDDRPAATALQTLNQAYNQLAADTSAQLEEQLGLALTRLALSLTVVFLLLTAIQLGLGHSITQPLAVLTRSATRISEGDLRAPEVEVVGRDELSLLTTAFDTMADSLRQMVVRMRDTTKELNSHSAAILASAEQQAVSLQERATTVQEITSTMEEMTRNSQQVSQRANSVASSGERTVEAGESGIEAVKDVAGSLERIGAQVEKVAENVMSLSERTQAIGEVIETVRGVAEQSNLLALNAAIEAVSVGAEGNRFGVVAGEMKSLAERSAEATVRVQAILGDIRKGINRSVLLTEEVVKLVDSARTQGEDATTTMDSLGTALRESIEAFQIIAAGTGEQQVGIEQISMGMQEINAAAEQAVQASSMLESSARDLTGLGEELKSIVERYQVG